MQRSSGEIETIKDLLEEKQNIILAETELHSKLIANAKKKTEAILENDIEKLEELTRWDEAVLEEIAKWEDRLERVVKALALWYRIDPASFNLETLLLCLEKEPEEIASKAVIIREESEKLRVNMNILRDLNEKNTLLLRRSLAIINYSLDVILGKSASSSVYDKTGRKKDDGKKSLFDTQV